MLTSRGWWLLFLIVFQLAVGVLLSDRGLGVLAILGLTALAWYLFELASFTLQSRLALGQLRVRRAIRDGRREVPLLWVGREFEVVVEVTLDSGIGIPFVALADRSPSGADLLAGATEVMLALPPRGSVEIRYQIRAGYPGELTFEGVRVRLADRQGFFYRMRFVREQVRYPVLPPLSDAEGNRRVDKSHNLIPPPGIHRLRAAGGGGDLLDLRDYRDGDPPKMIAWKASARRDRLITKEFESDVPLKCTLLVDKSQSVRVGQPRSTMLTQLSLIASGVAQAATSDRDLVGLVLFDEEGTEILPAARTSRHLIELLHRLATASRARPLSPEGSAPDLSDLCTPVAQELYPELMDRETNRTTWMFFWNPLLDGRWAWTVLAIMALPLLLLFAEVREVVASAAGGIAGTGDPLVFWLVFAGLCLSPVFLGLLWWGLQGVQTIFAPYYERRARRKRLAALFNVLDHGPVGVVAHLVEDDAAFAHRAQRFLAAHHIRYPLAFYDEAGRYLFRSAGKIPVLARALHASVARGRDNELFVILADLIELEGELDPLLSAIKVAVGRHHQVMVICPWLSEVPPPEADQGAEPDRKELLKRILPAVDHLPPLEATLMRDAMVRYHQAFYRVRKAFARLGVILVRAEQGESVRLVLNRLDRLRSVRRRR